jgi:hypothetical protein
MDGWLAERSSIGLRSVSDGFMLQGPEDVALQPIFTDICRRHEAVAIAEVGFVQGAISAMLLYPALGEGIRADVLFFPVDMSGHDETSGWDAPLSRAGTRARRRSG